jgi:molybdopterin biosynthesis enzyme MoaB
VSTTNYFTSIYYSIEYFLVSDRCFRKESNDESGKQILNLLRENFDAMNTNYEIVPDESDMIESALIKYCDTFKVNCIFTTGKFLLI